MAIPYSRLFSLGAIFPKFHEWAHCSGKFILGCYMKFYCGSLLQKAEISTGTIMSRYMAYEYLSLKPCMGCKVLQSTIVAKVIYNSSGWVWMLILQAISTLRNQRFGNMRLFSMCTATANGLWILCQFTNKHLIYYWCPDAHVHSLTLCEILRTWVFWLFVLWISESEKFLLKLRTGHLGKFAPREINLLYGSKNSFSFQWLCYGLF